jgi:trk system potassium uptake protein TrkH
MARYFRSLPFFVVLLFAAAGAMMVPAAHGAILGDYDTGRVFFYFGLLLAVAAVLLGFATQARGRLETEQSYLISLLLAYLWLPFLLAVPAWEVIGNTRFINVYFDMVSSLTTTGAPIFESGRLPPSLHLWRALVGWLGGLMIWITAVAVLAPLNLGGYEVTSEANISGRMISMAVQTRAAEPADRLRKHTRRLTPIYVTLTAILAFGLAFSGEDLLTATIHAMSTLATSGITNTTGLVGSPAGFMGELLIFLFLIFAVSRRTFISGIGRDLVARIARDREVRLAMLAVIVLPSLLFLRHWLGAWEVDDLTNLPAALSALWGGVFTVLSFLTTTGFVSDSWAAARSWSGLQTPGILLMGLAMVGGGVATTAGGLKLLRIYALYKHGAREIGRLIHPHSVAGAGRLGRRIRREGAYIAWVFFMLFMVSTGAVMLALAATGIAFEPAMILAVSALSTTGPLALVAAETPISYLGLSDPAKIILVFAMFLGRFETLVFLAVFNPAFWRR